MKTASEAPVSESETVNGKRLSSLKITKASRVPLNLSLNTVQTTPVIAPRMVMKFGLSALLVTSVLWFSAFAVMVMADIIALNAYSLPNAATFLFAPPLIGTCAVIMVYALRTAMKGNIDETTSPLSKPANDSLTGFDRTIPFILESLHSLSVDVTRMNDQGVSQKTWQAFQRGDKTAFTKRLMQNPDGRKARKKYKTDSVFRNTINHFITQFETMIAQAIESDHDGLLMSTLASSEVAKLYTFLCKVAKHQSILKSV